MSLIEIMIILVATSFVIGVFAYRIYSLLKHKGSSECACCKERGKNIFKAYYRESLKKEK